MANVEKFKFWATKVLPLVYDDSLSYYEFLGKVYEKLNETIDAVNANTEAINVFDKRIDDFITEERQARLDWEAAEALSRHGWETEQARKMAAFEAMFVSEYDATANYTAGDICTEDGKMYAANASTTGTFDPTKWDEIVLADYLAAYVAEAAEDLQDQYDDFLLNYQRTFGIIDNAGSSATDAISQKAATDMMHSVDFNNPGGNGDTESTIYAWSDGSAVSNQNFNSGNLIPCRAGQVIYGYNRSDPTANAFTSTSITFWDASEQFVSGSSVTGNSFTVPDNSSIRYVRIPYAKARLYAGTYNAIGFIQFTTDPPKYYDLHTLQQKKPNAVHNLSVDTTATLSADVTTDLIHSADLLWPGHNGDIAGKVYNWQTGVLVDIANWSTGNLIPCTPGQTFYLLYRYDPSHLPSSLAITFFDANGDFVTGFAVSQKSFVVPTDSRIKFVRTPYNTTYSADQRMCVTLRDLSEASALPKSFYNLHTVKEEVDEIKAGQAGGGQWNGKTWYAYGTSITSVEVGHYVNPLASMLGVTAVNKGIGGGGIGDLGAYSTGQVYDAICNITDGKLNADLITLETGANDVTADVPLGTIYDTGRTTLAGCLNDCIRYLQTNTTAQIAVTPSPANTVAPQAANQQYKWKLMIEEICRINCVAFIPNESNLGYAKLTSSDGSDYVVDQIHQTELGGYVYAENLFRYLKDLPTFKTSVPT